MSCTVAPPAPLKSAEGLPANHAPTPPPPPANPRAKEVEDALPRPPAGTVEVRRGAPREPRAQEVEDILHRQPAITVEVATARRRTVGGDVVTGDEHEGGVRHD